MRQSRPALKLRDRKRIASGRVETLEIRRLLSTITVDTTADDTTLDANLSLRQAIEVSNGTLAVSSLTSQEQLLVNGPVSATNTINFTIPTTDSGYNSTAKVWTIALTSALPTISTNAAIINGYSQMFATQNTLAQADNAKLSIAISGTGVGSEPNGLTIAQPGSIVSGLDIENFGGSGIALTAPEGVQVAGCFIGTDPTGETSAANATGISVENSNNTIGGTAVGDRNIISGNTAAGEGDGVFIPDANVNPLLLTVSGTLVENNFIGIDALGTASLANSQAGVADFGTNNTYGGTTSGLGNVISGNGADGLKAESSITIEGNYIGTNAAGTAALGNGPAGAGIANVVFPSTDVVATTITGNLVSGNLQGGVVVTEGDPTSVYTVSNNEIGTNAAGTAAIPNTGTGLQLTSLQNATVDDNLISGNTTIGLAYSGFGPAEENNVFQGNKIGTDITGTLALGNGDEGVLFTTAIGNLFGGTGVGQGNVVAFNGGDGVEVLSQNPSLSKHVQITENSIFSNTGLGIYLDINGVSNQFQQPPALTWAPIGGGTTGTLTATLVNGIANASYVIEIFSNPAVPAEGKTFVEAEPLVADGTGKGSVSVTLPTGVYTATTTAVAVAPATTGNTSQFALPATVTALSSSLNPSVVAQQVTFTAVVTVPGSANPATGSVTFRIDGVAGTPVSLGNVGGVIQAQFSTSSLSLGPHTVTATYTGDATHETSTISLPTQTVTSSSLISTATAVSSSVNPSTVGQSVTFTAVVTPSSPGTPTGSVTFTIDGVVGTPVSLGVGDAATFSTSTLTTGPHAVSAAYSGDSTFGPSSGTLPTQTVNPSELVATQTTVTSSLNPSTVGQSVTFTASVISLSVGTPTGSVTFTIDGVAGAPVSLGIGNEATFSTSTLTAGPHAVSAAYNGDSTFGPSSGTLPTQTVNPSELVGTHTTVSSSVNPSTVGQSVTFTAVVTPVSPGTPTGSVTFTIDGVVGTPVSLGVSDEASFSTSTLTAGPHAVSAAYSGDSTFANSTGTAVTQTVNPLPVVMTTTALTSSPNASVVGQQVIFTATITAADSGAVSGTVMFEEGTFVLGSGSVGADGIATFADSSLPVGSHTITAIYEGDASHSQSSSVAVAQVVAPSSVAAPTVLSLKRYGFHKQRTTLVLGFSSALDAASAQNVENYQILGLGGPGVGAFILGQATRVRKAVYDPTTLTVTLYPANHLNVHYGYRLTVDGTSSTGVRGVSGLLIDGSGNGSPGSNYEARVNAHTLAGAAPKLEASEIRAAGGAKPTNGPSAFAFDSLATTGELEKIAKGKHLG